MRTVRPNIPGGWFPSLLLGLGLSLHPSGPAALPGVAAQSKSMTPQEALQHEVTVAHKLIQVYVADRKGEPVRDLERADFAIFDNNRPQVILDFEKHFLSAPVESLTATKPTPARDADSLMIRKFLFLIDYERNDQEGIGKSRKAVLQFLETQILPEDQIALFSFSRMRGLVLHEYLTSDHQKIRASIKKVLDMPGNRVGWDPWADQGHSILGPETHGSPSQLKGDPGLISVAAAGGSSQLSSATVATASSAAGGRTLSGCLQELSKALRHIPGQKNIILFSRGFGGRILSKPREWESKAFEEMGKALASANSPVFSINTTAGSEAQRAKVLGDGTLDRLSELTGGKYFHDINLQSEIAANIQSVTGNYYVLGYAIPAIWDGKFHDIRVEVKRPGCKVFAQRGYFNPLPFSQMTPVEKHLHLLDLALGEKAYFEQHLNFPLTALPFAAGQASNTALVSEIPVTTIREVVGDSTELILLVFDPARTIIESRRLEADWSTMPQDTIRQYSTLGLAPGRYDCRIVIRNLVTGRAAVGACSVEIPEPSTAPLKLFPPLLLKAGRGSPYLHVARPENKEDPRDISLSLIFPFPAKTFVPLLGLLEPGTPAVYASLRCAGLGAGDQEARISAWLEPDGGGDQTPVPCAVLHAARQDDVQAYFLEFQLPNLDAGRYAIRIRAEDPGTGSIAETESRLIIGRE